MQLLKGHSFFFYFLPTDQIADTADEVICYSPSNKDSHSEIQSLNSFQSDSCDDNGKIYLIFKHAKFRDLLTVARKKYVYIINIYIITFLYVKITYILWFPD